MELMRALGALAEPPGAEHTRLADLLGLDGAPGRPDHTGLFVLELPPYASIYLGEEGMLGGAARDRIAGFWRALGQTPPAEPDHLSALLGLYAALGAGADAGDRDAAADAARHAQRALFWEHVACWLPPYLERVEASAPAVYRSWAALLGEALRVEAGALGPPHVPPLHLREAPPPLHGDVEGLDTLVDGVLTPIRSGVILTRTDLARMARALGTAGRVGERRFVLRGLIGQDAPGVLDWLASEAERQATSHRGWPAELHAVSGFWATRAESASAALSRLASEVR
jgi:hypothetical protein